MAKDGTMRGGPRANSGPKKKALADKLLEGKAELNNGAVVLPEPVSIEGVDMPPVKDFLKAKQKNGKDMCAEEVYKSTYLWLKKRRCEKLVSTQLLEQYAMSVSRWVQCEEAISEFGFLAKHPTTGQAITSPYVSMSQSYMKQATQQWSLIYEIVKANCTANFEGTSPQKRATSKCLALFVY